MKRFAYADGGSKQEITEAACNKKGQRNQIDDTPVDEHSSTTPKDDLAMKSYNVFFNPSKLNNNNKT